MGKTVVVIDDSSLALSVIEDALAVNGVEVFATSKPVEFFKLVFGKKPDLILTDLEMPVMSGADICRQLRNDPSAKEIPIVILSSLPEEQLQKAADTLGATATLSKASFDEATVANVVLPMLGMTRKEGDAWSW